MDNPLLRIRSRAFVLFICGLLLSAVSLAAPKSAKNLPANYRHWLDVEVPYIISADEKKEFLSLTTDQQRDSYINAFWRVRNPDPNSETNSYKEEHYRRLAYANEHFGNAKYENGWQTTKGRIYIVLGEPKQKAVYHEKPNVRDIEIWFYETPSPALPAYFNVMFFRRSASEDWRLYSPRFDGPAALVTTGESQNDPKMALRFIKGSLGSEAAKIACTLIPSEPCDDSKDFQPSMDSDLMLETINSLADNPLSKAARDARRSQENVTTSIFTGDQGATMNSVVFRDEDGKQTLSYLLSFARPQAAVVGSHPDGNAYYDLALRTSVMTPDGKSVFDQEDELTGNLNAAQAEIARRKIFAAEGRVPLAPGQYSIVATLTNKINHVATRSQQSVTVPAVNSQRIGISELVEYGSPAAVPDPHNQLPFSASKVRFTPRAVQVVNLRAGQKLPIAFQLWLPTQTAASPQKVHLRYVFGTASASHDQPTVETEEIDADNHDKAGNLVSGHTLDTSLLPVGTYRLVVTATADGLPQPAFAAMTIHVQRDEEFADRWTAYGSEITSVELDDLRRGLSAEAQGQDEIAKSLYAQALAESPSDTRPLDKLAALLDRKGDNGELIKLTDQPILTQTAIDPKTLLIFAQALTKSGNAKSVVRLLEPQMKLQPPTAPLYLALANAYEATGDSARAGDMRGLAAKLK